MQTYQTKTYVSTLYTDQNATVCNRLVEISKEVTAEIRTNCTPEAKIQAVSGDLEKKEQFRTTQTKRLVLDLFATNGCNVSKVCHKVGIDRVTFYRWLEKDKEFAEGVREAEMMLNDMVEDKLMIMIFKYDHGPSIRYFLDRRHPKYMHPSRLVYSRSRNSSTKTIEDLLAERQQLITQLDQKNKSGTM